MAIAKRFSFVRFSLRSLFVLVTAICLFLGYELNWIKRRHAFLDEHIKAFHSEATHLEKYSEPEKRVYYRVHNRKPVRAPYLLWLFDEPGWGELDFVLTDGLTKKESGSEYVRWITFYTSSSHPVVVKARRLFPEAKIIPMVDRKPDEIRFEEVYIVPEGKAVSEFDKGMEANSIQSIEVSAQELQARPK